MSGLCRAWALSRGADVTTYRVRSSAAGANNGTSWANAFTTLAAADAVDAAGDTILVAADHAESTAGAVSVAFVAGVKVICVDHTIGENPTTVTTGATVTNTTAANMSIGAQGVYFYGITFQCGSGQTGTRTLTTLGMFDTCKMRMLSTGASSTITGGNYNRWKDTTVRFADAGQSMSYSARFDWNGGGLESGGTSPTALISDARGMAAENLDLSAANAAINIVASTAANQRLSIRNSRLPASWSGALNSSTYAGGSVAELWNCDSGATNYKYQRAEYAGTIAQETTIIRSGGANDKTTGFSYKLTGAATLYFPSMTVNTPELVAWNEVTGSSVTATVEIIHDSATALNDDEVWLDIRYLSSASYPLGASATTRRGLLAAAAATTSSTATWTTTGLTNPNKRKLSVSFTPQMKGFVIAIVRFAKASTSVYVDPKVTLS